MELAILIDAYNTIGAIGVMVIGMVSAAVILPILLRNVH